MHFLKLAAPTLLLATPAAGMAADCQPAFLSGDQTITIDGVDIESGATASENFDLRVFDETGPNQSTANGPPSGKGPCPGSIRIARIDALPNPTFPAYSLRGPGNRHIEVLPDPSAGGTTNSDVVIANAPPGRQGRAVPFRVDVATEWGLRSGTFTEQLRISLIDAQGREVDSSLLTIVIVIPPSVSIRFVGAVIGDGRGGPAQVDLGTLSSTSETQSDRFGALIFSTSPYMVRFSSAGDGNLVREQGTEQIPYRLTFDGSLVDLAGFNEFAYLNPTPKHGDRRPMSVIVPPLVSAAGRYSDRITATVTAM